LPKKTAEKPNANSKRPLSHILNEKIEYDIKYDTELFWGGYRPDLEINNLNFQQADEVIATKEVGNYLLRPSTAAKGKVSIPKVVDVYEITSDRPNDISLEEIVKHLIDKEELSFVRVVQKETILNMISITGMGNEEKKTSH